MKLISACNIFRFAENARNPILEIGFCENQFYKAGKILNLDFVIKEIYI